MAILIENSQKKVKLDLRHVRRLMNKLLHVLDIQNKEVSLSFVDNDYIRELNKHYLGRDCPTNVMAFPLAEGEFIDVNPHLLGDIVISVVKAEEDALCGGFNFQEEIDFLIIHGLLHLLGYNHENASDEDTLTMRKKEQELFFELRGVAIDVDY